MKKRSASSIRAALIHRGPSPGKGRSAWVGFGDRVWTVGFPKGKTAQDSVAEQTKKSLNTIDERLQAAGSDKSRILEATVFLKDMSAKEEMDAVWREWVPENCGISRAALSCDLAPGDLVELKVTAAAGQDPVNRGPSPGRGRSAFVSHKGTVSTVGFPKGLLPEDDIKEQMIKSLRTVDERLEAAGSNKSKILEATVYLEDMSVKDQMDAVWRDWVPERCGISRACVGAKLGGGFLVEIKLTAAVDETPIVRGPSPGKGRSAFVKHGDFVWTVGFPKGKTAKESVAEQTQVCLDIIDERLQAAGTDKSQILEATVFLQDMSTKEDMDAVWREWVPESCGISRACVGADLAPEFLVEIKVTAALSSPQADQVEQANSKVPKEQE